MPGGTFRARSAAIALLVAGCANGSSWMDDNEASNALVEERQGGLHKNLGGVTGDWDFCGLPPNVCENGEGDCDTNLQCGQGMVCAADVGLRFGHDVATDICLAAHCIDGILNGDEVDVADCGGSCGPCSCDLVNGHIHRCNTDCPCTTGEGDCDQDSDCDQSGQPMVCAEDRGGRFLFDPAIDICLPAHCVDGLLNGDEVLFADCGGSCGDCGCALPNGHIHKCSPSCPCDFGEGDCDTDADCSGMLGCAHNVGLLFGMPPEWDVCTL